jgi:hypothetical protein
MRLISHEICHPQRYDKMGIPCYLIVMKRRISLFLYIRICTLKPNGIADRNIWKSYRNFISNCVNIPGVPFCNNFSTYVHDRHIQLI